MIFPILISIMIIILNAFDAAISVWYITNNFAIELNPISDLAISKMGYWFVLPKIVISTVFGILVVRGWKYPIAKIGSVCVLLIYMAVSIYHIYGFTLI